MPTSTIDGHLEDGQIVRLLDGETDPEERARVEEHIAACAACGARAGELRRRSVRLTGLLGASDWEVPAVRAPDELSVRRTRRERARPARRPWLRVAAVVVLLLGAGLVASPVRAVVAGWLATQWERMVGAGEERAPQAPPPAAAPVAGTRVRFAPAGDVLTVEVAAHQAGGAVELRRGESRTATAEQVGGTMPVDLLVLPSGVRVRNDPGSAADYRVTVPVQVRSVRVRIGGAPPVTVDAAQIGAGMRVELR